MEPNGSGIEDVRERFARSEFHTRWLALTLERVDRGAVDVAMDVQPHHLNLMGTVHGGMIATLADTATGLALRSTLEPGQTFTTTQLGVTFLAPGREGRIVAHGRVLKSGRRMGYAEADVVDRDERLLARATATFAVLPERDQ